MSDRQRILVTAHGHPDFSLGGGELAAYNLFKAYAGREDVEAAFFLARHDKGRGATGAISLRRHNEYLWEQSVHNWLTMTAVNHDSLFNDFSDLIRQLKPTIVHIHHYAHMGLEYIKIIKNIDPSITVIMTLHEYMAICLHNGQMVKTVTSRLCFRESLDECGKCYPDITPESFWLRKHRYQSYFSLVDQFVTPSDFLRGRYIEWGLNSEKITTIENGQAGHICLPPRALGENRSRNRFGFFGQINPYKGIHILLQGLLTLQPSERNKITLEIHGANLEAQSVDFQKRIAELREPLENEGVLQWVGPYEPFQMASRMSEVDWVLVPSVWWENSPMVIQEAFTLGRPVICSDIGGMAEKVKNGVDGVHVPVSNSRAWGRTLLNLAEKPEEWDRLKAGICQPISFEECADAHMNLLRVSA